MAYKDILYAIETYPESPPEGVWQHAATLAQALGGEVTALAFHLRFPAPHNHLANMLVGLDQMAKAEEARSLVMAQEALRRFTDAASGKGLAVNTLVVRAPLAGCADCVAHLALTRDLCLVSIGDTIAGDVAMAERVIFGSSCPVIVFPEQWVPLGPGIRRVAIAWDGTRPAARAVADALPLLRDAAEVRVVTVVDDKPSAGPGVATDLVRHLTCHGVSATVDEVKAESATIGEALRAYAAKSAIDIMVMGAFGHSRAREFILGGATRGMLDNPPIPLFMAH